MWSKIQHPNILPISGFYYDESKLEDAYIVAPWQAKGDIVQYANSEGATHVTRCKLVCSQSTRCPRPESDSILHIRLGTWLGA